MILDDDYASDPEEADQFYFDQYFKGNNGSGGFLDLISSDGPLAAGPGDHPDRDDERVKQLQQFIQKPSLFFLIPGIKDDTSVRRFIDQYISKSIQTTEEIDQAGDLDTFNQPGGSRILEAHNLDVTAGRLALE